MSVESCLHWEWEDSRPPSPQHRYKSEFHLQPRCVPTGYGSTVLRRKDSTWRRFVEEVRFEKCLVPDHSPKPPRACSPPPTPTVPTTPTAAPTAAATAAPAPGPPPAPPRRYRSELEVWISGGPRLAGRQPNAHAVEASA
ncbi:CASP-like protein 4A1 [Thrips palmi]|uniref:CASP-like protein 4A1 n=1 Tax=Thrips palmi TaxID=161013 RepID=A0A6P8XWA1_THRPL|nr:CASP-like protein 4A1 [Thrips palmi]